MHNDAQSRLCCNLQPPRVIRLTSTTTSTESTSSSTLIPGFGVRNQHRLKDATAPRNRKVLHTSPMSGQKDQILLSIRIRRVPCTAQSYRCCTRESLHETAWSLQDFGPPSAKYNLIIITLFLNICGQQRAVVYSHVCTCSLQGARHYQE